MHTGNMHIIMHTESHNYVVCSVVQARRMHTSVVSREALNTDSFPNRVLLSTTS